MSTESFEERTKKEFQHLAPRYDSRLCTWYFDPLYRKVIETLKQESGNLLARGGRVLDVACGTGEVITRLAREFPASTFAGVDLTPEMVVEARAKTAALDNVDFIEASADVLPFHAGEFDIAICTESFHHFDKPREALLEIRRVLKHGGLFLLVDPTLDTILQKIIWGLGRHLEPHHKVYKKQALFELLKNNGFEIQRDFYFRLNLFVVAHVPNKG